VGRTEAYAITAGPFAYGGDPGIDGLCREQATQIDRARREATLRRLQQLVHEGAVFAPISELAFLTAVGRRLRESALGLIAGYALSAPSENVKLTSRWARA
jgi:hypothetical protein